MRKNLIVLFSAISLVAICLYFLRVRDVITREKEIRESYFLLYEGLSSGKIKHCLDDIEIETISYIETKTFFLNKNIIKLDLMTVTILPSILILVLSLAFISVKKELPNQAQASPLNKTP